VDGKWETSEPEPSTAVIYLKAGGGTGGSGGGVVAGCVDCERKCKLFGRGLDFGHFCQEKCESRWWGIAVGYRTCSDGGNIPGSCFATDWGKCWVSGSENSGPIIY
jgi:hypothetical protein